MTTTAKTNINLCLIQCAPRK